MVNPARSTVEPAFAARLLDFINQTLPYLDRRGRNRPVVEADTPLFATGLLDSMSILHLIAFIESERGEAIPDQLVVMKHFQDVNAISATFGSPQQKRENE